MAKLSYHYFIILIVCGLYIPTSGQSECPLPPKQAAFFFFGDSYFDSGNNNYIPTTTLDQANFWPYGETYFNFPTGRFSDGRLVSDFIVEYAKLPMIPPFLEPGINHKYYNGTNFASAGAGALVETFQGGVINLKTQLTYYKEVEAWLRNELGNVEAKMTISNAVYFFSIGSNDYMSPFLTNSTILNSFSSSQYVGMVVGNLTTVIQEIYKTGGRKFGFLNLGPLGCLPGVRILKTQSSGGCLKEASVLAKLHNEALSHFLSGMEKQFQDFKYSLYDFDSHLRQRMIHPSKYGFKEGKTACCGIGRFRGTFSCGGERRAVNKEFELCDNPKEYVFWDSYHLTERVYKKMADEMWSGTATKGPYNLKTLLFCL